MDGTYKGNAGAIAEASSHGRVHNGLKRAAHTGQLADCNDPDSQVMNRGRVMD